MAKTKWQDKRKAILADAENIAKAKVRQAGRQVANEMYQKAREFAEDYYSGYSPKRYKRQYELKGIMKSYYKEKRRGTNFIVTAGVEYDPSLMAGEHKSNSWYHQSGSNWVDRFHRSDSQSNGVPEYDWIFENFWRGAHPSGIDTYVMDTQSQSDLLNDYMENQIVAKKDSLLSLTLSDLGL